MLMKLPKDYLLSMFFENTEQTILLADQDSISNPVLFSKIKQSCLNKKR